MKDRQNQNRESSQGDRSKERDIRTDEKKQGGGGSSGGSRQGGRESGTGR